MLGWPRKIFLYRKKGAKHIRILITGGAGFIGSQVAEGFIAAGHRVTSIDNLSTGKKENLTVGATFYQGDLTDDTFLDRVFRHGSYDIISHHAAQINVRLSVSDPAFDAQINIVGGLKLLERARQYGVKHFIFASTGGAIYGEPAQLPVPENHPTRPIAPYGIAKLAFEHYLRAYSVNYGLKTTVLRYGNVYGPRQDPLGEAGVIAIFMGKLDKGETCTINGDGEQLRDYVYVGDIVQANLLAAAQQVIGTFNIGTGIGTSVNDIFKSLKEIYGTGKAERGPAKTGEIEKIYLDSTLASQQLGWKAKTLLPTGLSLVHSWLIQK